jgi:inosine-uridine nucleoside N-ribohydrolase
MGTTFWAGSRRGIACLAALVAVVAAFLCLARRADAASPVPVIVDTDIYSNADDVGALASAFALQKDGDANVIAVTVNSPTDRAAVATDSWKCVAAIDRFYGFPNVPIGAQMPDNGPDGSSRYIGRCGQLAPASTPAPASAVSVLRQALSSQANDSVVLVETGYEHNLEDLLQSSGGVALVTAKVKMLVVTGGYYAPANPTSPESNFAGDPGAAQYVAQNWPTEIVYNGDEVGNAVDNGYSLSTTHPVNSPVRASYEAYAGGANLNIPSYDPTTLYYAVVPTDTSLTATGPGTNTIDTSGDNTFTTSATADQYYLTLNNGPGLAGTIESLFDTLPPAGTITGTVDAASTHQPVQGVLVKAYDPFGDLIAQADTAANGTYTLPGVYAGAYTVQFTPASTYAPLVYNGQVLVSAGAATPNVNGALTIPAPVNTGAPTINGSAQIGQTLSEGHGSWTNSPTSYAYQWEDCSGSKCSVVAGATSRTYAVGDADAGYSIRVEESASNGGGSSAPAISAATAVVNGPSTPPPPVKISSGKVGRLLKRVLAVHGSRVRITALLRNDGYSFSFNAPAAGRLRLAWYESGHGKKVLVASVSAVFHKSGTARIRLVLTRKGRALLLGGRTVTITEHGSFTPLGGRATRASKSLRLRP